MDDVEAEEAGQR